MRQAFGVVVLHPPAPVVCFNVHEPCRRVFKLSHSCRQIYAEVVNLPVNDMAKREAIKEKLGFDVTKAIEIKNTKYDGEDENTSAVGSSTKSARRAAPIKSASSTAQTGRRYQPNKE